MLELGSKASEAIKHGIAECKKNPAISQANLAASITAKLAGWNPTVSGRAILTPALRAKLAGAFAGLAYNMFAAETGKPPL